MRKSLKKKINTMITVLAVVTLSVFVWLFFGKVREWLGGADKAFYVTGVLVLFFLVTGYLNFPKIKEVLT